MEILIPSLFVIALASIVFFVGGYFIRHPEEPTRFFTLGMASDSKFGWWWFRVTGYLVCLVALAFALVIGIHVAILTLHHFHLL